MLMTSLVGWIDSSNDKVADSRVEWLVEGVVVLYGVAVSTNLLNFVGCGMRSVLVDGFWCPSI